MKLVILLLVLVVLLFAASVWMGARQDNSPAQSATPNWTQNLRSLFGPDAEIASSDITSTCYQNGTFRVVVGRPCAADIAPSKSRMRNLRLALAGLRPQRPGKQVPIQIDPARKAEVTIASKGEAAVPVRVPLDFKNDTTPGLKVLKEGATLSLECKSAAALFCEMQLM